eukprot:gene7017-5054_t
MRMPNSLPNVSKHPTSSKCSKKRVRSTLQTASSMQNVSMLVVDSAAALLRHDNMSVFFSVVRILQTQSSGDDKSMP